MLRSARLETHYRLAPLAVLILLQAACSRTPEGQLPVFPVEGQVLFKGKPVADALVVLHQEGSISTSTSPDQSSAPRPTGRTDAEGKFRLHTYSSDDGAPEGNYLVAISVAPPPADHVDFLKQAASKERRKATPDILQMRYADPAKSNLKVQVKAAENALTPFNLE